MQSKKEEFTYDIQYQIGQRIEDLEAKSYANIEALAQLFQEKNDLQSWKPLHFLNVYNLIFGFTSKISSEKITGNSSLKSALRKLDYKMLEVELLYNDYKFPELTRPKLLNTIVFMLPALLIMGSMLISTYLITAKGYSGWIYLSGLIGMIISLLLFKFTNKFKTNLKEDKLVDFAKLVYTINHKEAKLTPNSKEQLIQFITNELEIVYHKRFSPTEIIPEN